MDGYVADPLDSLADLVANDATARRASPRYSQAIVMDSNTETRRSLITLLVGTVAFVALLTWWVGLGPAARDLRDHLHRDGPRVRALHHRQARRDEGDRLLRRLRTGDLVDHDRRDPLRRARDPRRRLREGAGDDLDRDDPRGRGGPDLPLGVVSEEGALRLGRLADARRHGAALGLGRAHVRRPALDESRRRRGLHEVAGPQGERRAARRVSRSATRSSPINGVAITSDNQLHQDRESRHRADASRSLVDARRPRPHAARDARQRSHNVEGRRQAAGEAHGYLGVGVENFGGARHVVRRDPRLVHRGRLALGIGGARDRARLLAG